MASREIDYFSVEDKQILSAIEVPMFWPSLIDLGLSSQRIASRVNGIGGSDANIIMSGDAERIERLWRVKRGVKEPEDLTSCLPVMLGSWTEAFNRQWYETVAGYGVDQIGASLTCSKYDWRRCTLDGFVSALGAVWEAKHTSAFSKAEEVLTRYMPQLQHNMAVAGADRAILSVIFGNHKWEAYEVTSDWLYQEELLIAEARFWDCLLSGERPVAAPVPEAPMLVGVREVCFEGNNCWASAAADWLENRRAAKIHGSAGQLIKALVEPDVSRAFVTV